ncbi:flavin reductase family protein [Jeotgalibacillus soli]|uniref:Flavin reductase like domain-containing protein n=1 Tax=Jeotgalibacillus soli TaxID=889306 RepID=A0A0C2VLT9_9BACL|nr:flavin reductase family protein [Jeotgalibacillus soli]KIL45431.1 hypothetical protein KP78_29750 [Jeotgalibacillus soli]
MERINPANLSEKERYKLLTGTIVPRPIAFVTTLSSDGIVNGAPFSYFNMISATPPLVAVSVGRHKDTANQKDTARNALQKKEFVVHLTNELNVEAVNEASAPLPPDESEITRAGLTLIESDTIDVPGINEANVRLECTLHHHLELSEPGKPVTGDLLIGYVTAIHLASGLRDDNGYIQLEKLKPIARLAGSNYAKLGESFSIERPTS